MSSAEQSDDVECPTCGRTDFASEKGMKWHHAKAHGETVDSDYDGPECPTCGRDDFKNKKGMKQHHAEIHDESIAGIEISCEWCGTSFHKAAVKVETHDRNFCSRDCHGKWKSENIIEENSPTWNGGRVELECEWCDDMFKRHSSKIQDNNHNFCSSGCYDEWSAVNHTDEDAPNWKGGPVELECEWCCTTTSVTQYQYENHEHNFCSIRCRSKWYSKNLSGEDSHAWKGGALKHYGINWNDVASQIRERDNHTCQRCGSSPEHISLSVHHITPIRLFRRWDTPNIEDSNVPRNLISLCRSCHHTVEKGNVTSPVPESHWRSE